jgi:hypothetical protein
VRLRPGHFGLRLSIATIEGHDRQDRNEHTEPTVSHARTVTHTWDHFL